MKYPVCSKDTCPQTMTGKKCVGPVKILDIFKQAKNEIFFGPVTVDNLSPSL